MARLALSTIGVKLGVQIESTSGVKPSAFKMLPNCKNIGGSSNEADTIDVTPLEADSRQYVAGLGNSGGSKEITFGLDPQAAIIDEWQAIRTAAQAARANNLACWGEVWFPNVPKAYYFTFEAGLVPLSDVSVATAAELAISNVVNEEKGWLTAVEPLESTVINGVTGATGAT